MWPLYLLTQRQSLLPLPLSAIVPCRSLFKPSHHDSTVPLSRFNRSSRGWHFITIMGQSSNEQINVVTQGRLIPLTVEKQHADVLCKQDASVSKSHLATLRGMTQKRTVMGWFGLGRVGCCHANSVSVVVSHFLSHLATSWFTGLLLSDQLEAARDPHQKQ